MKKKLFGGFMKGFTLVELMVVIAIIGILSAIVIANLDTTRARSRDHRRISDISNIQLALAAYLNRCGTYPTNVGNGVRSYYFILSTAGGNGVRSHYLSSLNGRPDGRVVE